MKKKSFFMGILFGLVLLLSYLFSLSEGRLHLVFCDVGQGDAAYIRTPSNQDILIDGGPNNKVLSCLGKHMPFYDRTIDVVVVSHPQKDHFSGILSVIDRYTVKYIVIGVIGNDSDGYRSLVEKIKKKKIPVKNLYTGDRFSLGDVNFRVLWPEKEWVASSLSDLSYLSKVSESSGSVLGLSTSRDLNDFSYLLHLSYGSFDALFTGDGDSSIQPEVLKLGEIPDVEVLKFPHHGSKTGILPEFLDKVKPELAVISVGKNSYGHPSPEAIKLLNDRKIEIKRTDKEGDIEITL